jgi:hypothetical protein
MAGVTPCRCATCPPSSPAARPSRGHGGTLERCTGGGQAHALSDTSVRATCAASPSPTPAPPGHPGRCATDPGAARPCSMLCRHPDYYTTRRPSLCGRTGDAPPFRATNSSPSSGGRALELTGPAPELTGQPLEVKPGRAAATATPPTEAGGHHQPAPGTMTRGTRGPTPYLLVHNHCTGYSGAPVTPLPWPIKGRGRASCGGRGGDRIGSDRIRSNNTTSRTHTSPPLHRYWHSPQSPRRDLEGSPPLPPCL